MPDQHCCALDTTGRAGAKARCLAQQYADFQTSPGDGELIKHHCCPADWSCCSHAGAYTPIDCTALQITAKVTRPDCMLMPGIQASQSSPRQPRDSPASPFSAPAPTPAAMMDCKRCMAGKHHCHGSTFSCHDRAFAYHGKCHTM